MFPVHCSIQRETMNPSPVKAHLYSLFPRDDNVSVSHFPQNNSTSGLVQGCVCVCVGGRNCRTNMIRQTLDIACFVQGECSCQLGLDGRICLQPLPLSTHLESERLKSHTGHSGSGLTEQILHWISLGPVTPVFWAIRP